jgi:L-threonylcarbamoyladenylate synthase
VLPKSEAIPDLVTAGGPTVGVRWPSHPLIQAVIRECDFPLAAPSANLSNQVSPTNAEHVRKQLGDQLPLIVDGGQAQVGIESTVIDLTVNPPQVLRPGMIHEESLVATIGLVLSAECGVRGDEKLRSPGLLRKHYAPKAKLIVRSWRDTADLNLQLSACNFQHAKTQIIAHTHIPSGEGFGGVSVIPHDAEAYARAIYAEWHRCDEAGAMLIVVEALPDGVEWRAVADRLNRAVAD